MRRNAILIVTALLLAASFLAIGATADAQVSPVVRGDPIPGDPGLGVELGLDPGNGKILELLVYRGQKLVQGFASVHF
jgi:hypothetical protein